MTTDKSRLADVHNTIFFFCCMALNKPSNYTYSPSATVKSGSTSSLFSGLSTYWSIEGRRLTPFFQFQFQFQSHWLGSQMNAVILSISAVVNFSPKAIKLISWRPCSTA
jgi:hypothetical protein